MELNFLSISVFFPFLLCLFMLMKIVRSSKAKNSILKLPPGPRQLPLIGNLHQLVGPLAHHILRDLANKHGPLIFLRLGLVPTIVVSSAEIAEEVLKTHGIIFAERSHVLASKFISYNFTDIVFSPYGDSWRQLRKICTAELLSSRRVQTFRSIREEEVLNLVKEISSNAGSTVNLSKLIFSLTYTITATAAFGEKCKDQEAFSSLLEEIVKIVGGSSIADMYPSVELLHVITGFRARVEKMQQKLDKILENIVGEHKRRKTTLKTREGELKEDLVDVLLRIQKHGDIEIPLTDDSIKAVIFDIFSAGTETSSTAVEWAMSEMLKNPQVMERAQAEVRKVFDERRNVDETGLHELKYLQAVIKETLRLHPSAPLLVPRENSEQCEINGFVIPFGGGRRICPGVLFGIANMELPLAQLLYHFDWKLPNGLKQEELDMTEEFGITVRRKNDLHLIPIPYHPFPCSQMPFARLSTISPSLFILPNTESTIT